MKTRLGAVRIVRLEHFEAHRDIATIAAIRAAEPFAVIVVIVVDHHADADIFERIEDLAHDAA